MREATVSGDREWKQFSLGKDKVCCQTRDRRGGGEKTVKDRVRTAVISLM